MVHAPGHGHLFVTLAGAGEVAAVDLVIQMPQVLPVLIVSPLPILESSLASYLSSASTQVAVLLAMRRCLAVATL